MKYLLALAGAIIVGYVVLGEWLDSTDVEWLEESHRFEDGDDLLHLPHPWSTTGKDPRRFNA